MFSEIRDRLIHRFGGVTREDITPYLHLSGSPEEQQQLIDLNLRLANDSRFREIVYAFPNETEYPYESLGTGSPFANRTEKARIDLQEYLEQKGLSGSDFLPSFRIIRNIPKG
ncbi:MAG TPA: hypothetical protein VJB96_00790 [Patescibacteria group bacterium]|nr:hypothetical protein [Patescibacteria group bacterium]